MKNKSKLFSGLKLLLRTGRAFFFVSIVFVASSYAMDLTQPMDRTITGSVTGQDDQMPLVGVSVILKGTQIGTFTDGSGNYSLAAPEQGGQLVFSFVGYTSQTIDVGTKSTINVVLELDQKTLDEVVVIGYGTQSRRFVTGSVTKVDMKETEALPNTNIMQSMRGRVAGVQFTDNGRPGQGGSLLIRGPRSLSGGNDPLVVVDGIMFNGSINFLSPNDIESMEVLKDASAAAIYGSRAANGVILVTTKKGTTEKPTIRMNAFSGVSDWSKEVNLLSPERYLEKTLEMRRVLGLEADPALIKDYLAPSEVANYESGQTINPWEGISQQGRLSSYDLSISGRTDKTNYYLSGSITDERGLIYNDNQKRLSIRSNIETKVADWLTVGLNANFLNRDLSGKEANIGNAYYNSPYGTWYYEDGHPTRWTVSEDQVSSNPMYASLLNENEEIYTNIFTNFYAVVDVPFIEGLSYRLNYSPNYRVDHNYNFTKQDIYRNDDNTSASKFNRQEFDWVQENILTYSKQLNPSNAFDVTLLYGRNHRGSETTTANASQLASDVLGWNNLGLGGVLTNTSTASSQDGVSSMLRLNYRLKEKHLMTFTIRRDGSSVFAKNNKFASFPSASYAWIVSEEDFLKNLSFVNMLKMRLSYGAVGNQAINPYQSLSTSGIKRYVFGDGGSTSIGMFTNRMSNADLKWETTYSANAAIDFELLGNRVGGTIEYYNMNTKDLLVQRSLPTMTGFNSVWTNLGATSNKGLEFSVNTVNTRNSSFEWSSGFVFSANRNEIVHLYNSDTNGDGIEDDDLGNLWFIGEPMNVTYDYTFDGIYQEGDEIPSGSKPGDVRLKDLNNDGVIGVEDRSILGSADQPLFRWGLSNTFRYKSLTLSLFVNAMQGWMGGFNRADPNSNFGANYPSRSLNQFDNGWWTPENKSNTSPSLAYNNPKQHNYYFSRNFIRVQDVSLAYEFPKKILDNIKLNDLKVFASGKNLKTFDKWPGTDPESGGGATGYPMPKSITLGLNFGF